MKPEEILAIALQLSGLVSAITVGLTAVFKTQFPNSDGRVFSVPCGAFFAGVLYLATLPLPVGLQGWLVFSVVVVIGGLLPSGLFDAGVSALKKARL